MYKYRTYTDEREGDDDIVYAPVVVSTGRLSHSRFQTLPSHRTNALTTSNQYR